MHQAPDDLEFPSGASREHLDRPEDVGLDVEQGGELPNLLPVSQRHQSELRAVGIEVVEHGVKPNVLLARQVHVEARILKDDPDLAPDSAGLGDDIIAADPHPAGGWDQGGRQDRDGRRLAGAVRPEQGKELTRLDREGDPVDGIRLALSVSLDEILDLDDGGAVRPRCDAFGQLSHWETGRK